MPSEMNAAHDKSLEDVEKIHSQSMEPFSNELDTDESLDRRTRSYMTEITSKGLKRRKSQHPIDRSGFHPEEYEKNINDEYDRIDGTRFILRSTDPANPLSWNTTKKIIHTIGFGTTTFTSQFAASAISPAILQLSQEFHVGREISVLAFSIFVLGNGLGTIFWAPVSEIYGRKVGVFLPCFISGIFMLVTANVTSIWAVLVFRFVAGVFAAAPIVSSGGALADLWRPNQRAASLVLYATNIILGSNSAPVIGALLVRKTSYGWRWSSWLCGFLQIIVPVVNTIILDETYAPVIENRMAKMYRIETGMWEIHSELDGWKMDINEFLHIHLLRPLLMFITPIVFLMVLFASFVYGLLFLIITEAPAQFQKQHHFSPVVSYLPLFCVAIGFLFGGLANVINSKRYARISEKLGRRPDPEERLPAMMCLGWLMPVGCFIFGWTLYPHIPWEASCVGLICVGTGLAVVFQGCLVYIVDSYTRFAASGIAANTIMRSIFGGVFPLFATQMYNALNPQWASTLLGCVACLLVPIPWIFYFFGARIRQNDPFKDLIS